MKLVRYGRPGKEKPGMLDEEGILRDLSAVIADLDAGQLSPKALARLEKIKPDSLPKVRGNPRFGVPLAGIGKIVAVGLNYASHAREAGLDKPSEPVLFMKAISSLSGPDDDIMLPRGSKKADWEVELGIVIGSRAQYVSEKDALSYVAGYCVVNDVSEREYQFERGPQWDKGKGCDTFCPVGPWLVTRSEIENVQRLDLYLDLNEERMQTGSTRDMIFSAAKLVSYVSRFMTLEPGDLIATGTPAGVGIGMRPPRFLQAGDQLRLGIAGLGEQQQQVVAYKKAKAKA